MLSGLHLCYIVFGTSEEALKALQTISTTIQDTQKAGQEMREVYCPATLCWNIRWTMRPMRIAEASEHSIEEPTLPKYRRRPREIGDGTQHHQLQTQRSHFRQNIMKWFTSHCYRNPYLSTTSCYYGSLRTEHGDEEDQRQHERHRSDWRPRPSQSVGRQGCMSNKSGYTITTQLDHRFGQKAPLEIEQILLDTANRNKCVIPEASCLSKFQGWHWCRMHDAPAAHSSLRYEQ